MNCQPPTDEQRMIVDSFREFLEGEVRPIVCEHRGRFIPKQTLPNIT